MKSQNNTNEISYFKHFGLKFQIIINIINKNLIIYFPVS